MEKKDLLYTGKAKAVYATDDASRVIIHYNDDATAGNGEKHDVIADKGVLNNRITTLIYGVLNKAGVPTHYHETLNEREQLCEKVERLLDMHDQMRLRLHSLTIEVESLRQERDRLTQRIDAACQRVDTLLGQLPATADS